MHRARKFLAESDGATAVEYAFLLATILLVAIATVEKLGEGSKKAFQAVEESLVVQ